jgi:hypothetical protein
MCREIRVGKPLRQLQPFGFASRKLASHFAWATMTACLAASSLLAMPASTAAAQANGAIEPLICASAERSAVQPSACDRVTPYQIEQVTPIADPAIREQISSFLLGICYFGLPISVALAIWLYDKRSGDRLAQLKAQIDLLERIWQRNLQA